MEVQYTAQERQRELNRRSMTRYRDKHREAYREYQRNYQASELQSTKNRIKAKSEVVARLEQKVINLTALGEIDYSDQEKIKRATKTITRLKIQLIELQANLERLSQND